MFTSEMHCKANVSIVARERGKKVTSACRDGHNRWVNFGREYLAHVVAPTVSWEHLEPAVVKYMGFGIGGKFQTATIAGSLATDYPGQHVFDPNDLTVVTLERPVKVSGVAGVGTSAGTWMNTVTVDSGKPAFIGSPASTVEFLTLFSNVDLHLGGSYTSLPLSEVGMFLSTQTAALFSNQVYDYGSSPSYINNATRQKLVAYFPFSPITKTPSISLEVRWALKF